MKAKVAGLTGELDVKCERKRRVPDIWHKQWFARIGGREERGANANGKSGV